MEAEGGALRMSQEVHSQGEVISVGLYTSGGDGPAVPGNVPLAIALGYPFWILPLEGRVGVCVGRPQPFPRQRLAGIFV